MFVVGGRLFKHVPVCAEVALSGHIIICFQTSLPNLRSGLYTGISITEMWSRVPEVGRGSALYAFFTVV